MQFHGKIETKDIIMLLCDVKSKLITNLKHTLNKHANEKNTLLIK